MTFDVFTDPLLDAAGEAAFWARLTGSGVNNSNNAGIWSEGSGSFLELARRPGVTRPPGAASGVYYGEFLGSFVLSPIPLLNMAGETAFRGSTDGSPPGVDVSSDMGIWSGTPEIFVLPREKEAKCLFIKRYQFQLL